MSFPNSPNFRLAAPGSAWAVFQQGDTLKFIETNGASFIATLQQQLRDATELAVAKQTYDGTTIVGSAVTLDKKWGTNTFKALWSLLHELSVSQSALDAIAQASRAHRIDDASVWGAMKVIFRDRGITSIRVLAHSVMPAYNIAPPGAVSAIAVTDASPAQIAATTTPGTPKTTTGGYKTTPRTPAPPATPTPPATPPVDDFWANLFRTTPDTYVAPDFSIPGTPVPTQDTGLAPVTPGAPLAQRQPPASTVPWKPILAVTGVAVALGIIGYMVMKSPSRAPQGSR